MKKKYVNPAMEIVEIGLNTLICTSSLGMSPDSASNGDALSPELYMDNFE